MQFTTVLISAILTAMAAATPVRSANKMNSIFARDYQNFDCSCMSGVYCTVNNAPNCAYEDCDCCCDAVANEEPTASLPPVGK
ncbi:hypothetical protein DOTSEDRAFT_24387 [Dothistroma septosporum NZE10]|uniref:Uncharacterized protein n=1 Tax=Dothistroma septosporum (strain NZE10 / CBS 128990) TaxID=675120 RepID=N1PLE3_DOTSN|nr:hypothetical protein DOTSEDRAFT_24387 [Dothistroma septosporum NZE10]